MSRSARNYEVLIGTPIDELVALARRKPDTNGYIMGGPMMGFPLPAVHVPVVKATNCIIAASAKLFPPPPPAMPCIRCTRCAEVCPADLQPQELYWFAQAKNFGKAQEYSLFDCIECGAAAMSAPATFRWCSIYRFAKSEIWARESRQAAPPTRRANATNSAEQRIEREKQEKAEKLAAKEKAAQAAKLASTPPLTPEQQAELAESRNEPRAHP